MFGGKTEKRCTLATAKCVTKPDSVVFHWEAEEGENVINLDSSFVLFFC
jgi:hypothetical protein